jgi:hypothetical protein
MSLFQHLRCFSFLWVLLLWHKRFSGYSWLSNFQLFHSSHWFDLWMYESWNKSLLQSLRLDFPGMISAGYSVSYTLSYNPEGHQKKPENTIILFFPLNFKTRSCYIAQANLKLTILLCHPPEDWDYRYHHVQCDAIIFTTTIVIIEISATATWLHNTFLLRWW